MAQKSGSQWYCVVERFSGRLLKVSNWTPRVRSREGWDSGGGGGGNAIRPEKWPPKFTCQNARAGGWQVVKNMSTGAKWRIFLINDVNYVNPGSTVPSRSPDIIQLVFFQFFFCYVFFLLLLFCISLSDVND